MKKPCALLLPLVALFGSSCGSDNSKDNPQPVNPIPANSVAVKIDGVPMEVDLSKTVVNYHVGSRFLGVAIYARYLTGNPLTPILRVSLSEFTGTPGKITLNANSASSLGLGNTSDMFSSYDCPTLDRNFEVVAMDQVKQTISLRFSGKACGGSNGSEQRVISEGQLNLPYRTI
jgi:hypothetical protein